ncbi:MAG: hypothetical protein E7214_12250 [Clostridium sp.]|nr:hypothetical protein [Clostridium sp.]
MGILINQVNETQKITRTKRDTLKTPNWSIIPTKGMQVPSDKELVEKIKNLAKREAVAKTNKEFEVIEAERKKLNAQFLSKVSPDRKSLYKDAEKEINKMKTKNNNKKVKPLADINLLEILMRDKNEIALKSGGTFEAKYNSKGGYDYDIKADNKVVLGSINGNWTYSLTPAEEVRQDEFNKIYYNSCQGEKAERARGALRPSSYFKNSNVEPSFDIKA